MCCHMNASKQDRLQISVHTRPGVFTTHFTITFLEMAPRLEAGDLQERALRSDLHSMLAARPQPQKYRAFFGHRWVDVANDHNIIQK